MQIIRFQCLFLNLYRYNLWPWLICIKKPIASIKVYCFNTLSCVICAQDSSAVGNKLQLALLFAYIKRVNSIWDNRLNFIALKVFDLDVDGFFIGVGVGIPISYQFTSRLLPTKTSQFQTNYVSPKNFFVHMSKSHAHTYQAWKQDIMAFRDGDKCQLFLFFVWFINRSFFDMAVFIIL